jgi:NAD(P)-dependent dehydrogenase (short-subunit alcohol dehydrogenase family)
MSHLFRFDGKRVVIIGGTSGIGLATAKLITQLGGQVVIAGRSAEKLEKAKNFIESSQTECHILNNRNEGDIKEFFSKIGLFDYLFTPGASYTRGPITADLETAQSCFEGKFWPQYMAVKYAVPYINKKGAIVLMSGAFSQRPPNDGASYAACNAGIESLGKALAVELAPIRVNVIAPGTIRTPFVWEGKGKEVREKIYDDYAKQCLLAKVGEVEDIAEAVVYLLLNQYTTGSTLFPDGGYTLR